MKHIEKRKQSLYFPVEMLDEMQREAERLERPVSWVIQQAWKLSKDIISGYPGTSDLPSVLPTPSM
ncbi:MAG: TIGR04563 family protein [Deltaproteobacteria bacterium]|nr:TIGR04563 family protein [Deltaproteobacteria bacterium]